MRVLHLTLHRQWFAAIASGEKKEEYRATTPFWSHRLQGRAYDEIHFRNGYHPASPFMRVQYLGVRIANWQGQQVFALQLGAILEVRNWPPLTRQESSPSTSSGSNR